jgi:hypothetical protein
MTILPKGEIGGAAEGVDSVMLNTESKKSAYFFDYKQKVPVQPEVSPSFGMRRRASILPLRFATSTLHTGVV